MSPETSDKPVTLDQVTAHLSTFDGQSVAARLLELGNRTLHVGVGIEEPTLSIGQAVRVSLAAPGVHDELTDALCKVVHVVPVGVKSVYSLDVLDWISAREQLPADLLHLMNVRDTRRWSPDTGEAAFVDVRCAATLLSESLPIRDLAPYGMSAYCPAAWMPSLELNHRLRLKFRVPGEEDASKAAGFVRHIGEDETSSYIGIVFDAELTHGFDELRGRIDRLLSREG